MRSLIIAVLVLTSAAPACTGAYYVQDDEVYTDVAPPPVRTEVIVAAPGPGYMWVPGHWYWAGRQYVWSGGYWARPPAPHQYWVRSGWVWHNNRYRYVPGRWAAPPAVPHHPYYRPARPRPAHNPGHGHGNGHGQQPPPRTH
ncbi:MAG: YXWGXW repeat-containing protein [Myxococcota bacterium]